MFDVSFSELMVIAVVALLVIGPEKLPKVARTLGALTGRLQRYVAQVKEEVNREARFEDLQKLQAEIKQGWDSAEQEFKEHIASVEQAVSNNNVMLEKPKRARKPATIKAPTPEKPTKKVASKSTTKTAETKLAKPRKASKTVEV